MQPVAQAVGLTGLKLHLGPELRAMFPVVLNMGIAGDVELSGLLTDPSALRVAGTIHLDGGEVRCTCISAARAPSQTAGLYVGREYRGAGPDAASCCGPRKRLCRGPAAQ